METGTRRPGAYTPWIGWIWFGLTMLVLSGIFNVIDGLTALFKDEVFVQGDTGRVIFNYTAWGWIMLVTGAVQIVVGSCLAYASTWARIAAVILVLVNAIEQLTFIPAYPVWSTIIIGLDVMVLWAIIAHGDEQREFAERY